MIHDLVKLGLLSILISTSTFGGGSQALFYQYSVVKYHWLTATDLSSALSFGYASPGPSVFVTTVFIGYRIGGLLGALVGAISIFAVPFFAAFLAIKHLGGMLKSYYAQYVIRGIGLTAAGLVLATAVSIIGYKTVALWQIAIAATALTISLRYRVNPFFLLLAGLMAGIMIE